MRAFIDELLSESPELENSFSELIEQDMPRGPARTRARKALREFRRQAAPAPGASRGDRREHRPAA